MPAGPVVGNNTPLVALWALGRLDLLRELYGTVLIPPAVHSEFVATERELRLAMALIQQPRLYGRPSSREDILWGQITYKSK